jgi:Leucine-rich repeat (LRR) protein
LKTKILTFTFIVLDLSDNKIEIIDPDTFTNLPSLNEINLSFNRIRQIYGNSLPENVKTMNLGNNKLDNIKFIENLVNLITIDLRNNQIRTLQGNTFKNNQLLVKIFLAGNKISSLSPRTFDNLRDLQEVNLEENECLSTFYEPKTFKALSIDIEKNCQLTETENTHEMISNFEESRDENIQTRIVSYFKC